MSFSYFALPYLVPYDGSQILMLSPMFFFGVSTCFNHPKLESPEIHQILCNLDFWVFWTIHSSLWSTYQKTPLNMASYFVELGLIYPLQNGWWVDLSDSKWAIFHDFPHGNVYPQSLQSSGSPDEAFATEVEQLGDSECSELLISGQLIRVKGWWRKGARAMEHGSGMRGIMGWEGSWDDGMMGWWFFFFWLSSSIS